MTARPILDNQELKRVLATAHRPLGRKIDVVGIDACPRTMIEVAYQLRDHAQILVGSEEVEPGPGWPHAAIRGDLTKNPTMTPANSRSPLDFAKRTAGLLEASFVLRCWRTSHGEPFSHQFPFRWPVRQEPAI